MFTKLIVILLCIVVLAWAWIVWEWTNAPYYDEKTNTFYKKNKKG
jgi:hypothetical protein